MEYTKVRNAVDVAWYSFYASLIQSGFTEEQVLKIMPLLDSKDSYNDVMDCVMEVAR